MKIEYFSSPVPFYIIREYLTKDEYSFYFKQIQKLKPMLKREGTGGAVDLEGGLKKQNQGVWIDSQHPITKLNDKLFGPVSWETRNDWFYRMLTKKMNYSILLNYYEDGDYYLPHIDDSIITTILYLWEEPKTFTGGELCFGEFVVPIENNSMVIFPSMTEHSVNRLEGYGRWAITNFLHEHIEPPVRNKLNVLNVSA
jgi:predicted 2-oxoglutarate/Fe(II)-dependent dioxygenase YbiX